MLKNKQSLTPHFKGVHKGFIVCSQCSPVQRIECHSLTEFSKHNKEFHSGNESGELEAGDEYRMDTGDGPPSALNVDHAEQDAAIKAATGVP